jgi:predicted Rossmann-fold nucleotide-binding protein
LFWVEYKIPHEQQAKFYIRDSIHLMEVKYYFTRKLIFIKESHPKILFPGGFGSLDEGFENLFFFKTRKCMPRNIVLLDHEEEDYWDCGLDLLDSLLLKNGFASTEDPLFIKRDRNAEASPESHQIVL